MTKKRQYWIGLIIGVVTVIFTIVFDFIYEVSHPEPCYNVFTLFHFSGVIALYLVLDSKIELQYKTTILVLLFIVVVEIMEYIHTPNDWVLSYVNNCIDMIAGIVGLIVGLIITHGLFRKIKYC